jgi:hypothetical protein
MDRHSNLPVALVAAVDAFKFEMDVIGRRLSYRDLCEDDAQTRVNLACDALSHALRAHVERSPELEEEIGTYVFGETFGIFVYSTNLDRWRTKPRGYAGDYYTIDLMYQSAPAGEGRLGRLIDRWALSIPAVQAVCNRRELLADAIRHVAWETAGSSVRITSLASGPAREILDVLGTPRAGAAIEATCVDIDERAIAYASAHVRSLGASDSIAFVQDNVIRMARGRGKTTLPPQHMIYSVGLIDYLEDEHVVSLLDWIHDQLVPGGTVIVGNFDHSNPDRAFMDHVLDWRLIHRSASDLRALFARSRFGCADVDVRSEVQGVNLFAFCRKPAVAEALAA